MTEIKKGLFESNKKVFAAIGIGIAVLGLLKFTYETFFFVTTDNAMVQGHATLLSARVNGIITDVLVDENQKVDKDQLLVQIKIEDYQNSVDQKKAEVDSLSAMLEGARRSYNRTKNLYEKGAMSQEHVDVEEANMRSLQARLEGAQAVMQEALLNKEYTRIKAPRAGLIARKSCEVGMLATAGQPLLGFVAGDERWIVANLKETEMQQVKVNQKVMVVIDAYSKKTFNGIVHSMGPATGATFTLLPPDNATGNFTKVIQRVPVRIELTNVEPEDKAYLQHGLSAVVKIRVVE